ncbi:MAG TPA: hypothetical protein VI461_04625, partial [Chitinophagaceae bacterium]|nr:hypothetical protein [Chitinophagaceae bacterium]
MKKTAIILGTAFLFATAAVNAQNDTIPKEPEKVQVDTMMKEPVTTTTTPTTDRWNNWSPEKYKMLPMPAPLTTEQIFPVIGTYSVTGSDATVSATIPENTTTTTTENTGSLNVTITLDETSKGIALIDGLPQGRLKAYLKKSPATYMIPVQKGADEKDVAEGVLIYDKDNNKLDVCIGCKYNAEDPASAFVAPVEPVVEEQPAQTTKSKKAAKAKKAKPVVKKTWKYSGSKNVE